MISSKILAGVLALGILSAGAGVYAYSMLVPSTIADPASDAVPSFVDDDSPASDAPCCSARKSCCH
jgi:hypothetical protein